MERVAVKDIRDGAIKVLNEYMKQFGYEESGTGTTYAPDGSKITFKFDFMTTDSTLKEGIRERDFKLYCFRYGFKPENYNALVVEGKSIMRLIGFNPKARKNPCVLIEEDTGKEFVAPVEYVKFYMKKES